MIYGCMCAVCVQIPLVQHSVCSTASTAMNGYLLSLLIHIHTHTHTQMLRSWPLVECIKGMTAELLTRVSCTSPWPARTHCAPCSRGESAGIWGIHVQCIYAHVMSSTDLKLVQSSHVAHPLPGPTLTHIHTQWIIISEKSHYSQKLR